MNRCFLCGKMVAHRACDGALTPITGFWISLIPHWVRAATHLEDIADLRVLQYAIPCGTTWCFLLITLLVEPPAKCYVRSSSTATRSRFYMAQSTLVRSYVLVELTFGV
jgi:hypothetical protein